MAEKSKRHVCESSGTATDGPGGGSPSSPDSSWLLPHSVQSLSLLMLHAGGQQPSLLVQVVVSVPPRQLPFWQVSPLVQPSRSSHGSPFSRFCVVHIPLVGSQMPRTQPIVSCEQFFGCPP